MENLKMIAIVFVIALVSTISTEIALAYNKTLAIESTHEIHDVIDDALALTINTNASVEVHAGLSIPVNGVI